MTFLEGESTFSGPDSMWEDPLLLDSISDNQQNILR